MSDIYPLNFDKYLLLDKIGEGGMAELYLAKMMGNEGFEKYLAIKKIIPALCEDERLVAHFIEEARLAALLHHPNIVQVYDFGKADGTYFLAMEYLFGKDLKRIIEKCKAINRRIELLNILYIVSKILDGLDYAHHMKNLKGESLDITHRDISPHNIFITYDGQVKLIDFGLAKTSDREFETDTDELKGKAAYMSPEQVTGVNIDSRSDIYCTGIIFYELLCGKRLYSGDFFEILQRAREARFDPIEEQMERIDPRLNGIMNKCLARLPEDRYQTASEMSTDLDELITDLSIRSNSRKLAAFMHELYEDDLCHEEQVIRNTGDMGEFQICPFTDVERNFNSGLLDSDKTLLLNSNGTRKARLRTRAVRGVSGLAVLLVLLSATIGLVWGTLEFKTRDIDLARTALHDKRYAQATALFEDIFKKNPDQMNTLKEEYIQALKGQISERITTDPKHAETLISRLLSVQPDDVASHIQMGLVCVELEEYERAIGVFQEAAKLDPDHPDAYFNMGFIYAKLKDYTHSVRMFEKAVQLKPAFLDEALFNLAVVQIKTGEKDQAMKNLEKALEINPQNALARKHLERFKSPDPSL